MYKITITKEENYVDTENVYYSKEELDLSEVIKAINKL